MTPLQQLLHQAALRDPWVPHWPALANPALLRTLQGHSGGVRSVAVAGPRLVSGSDDHTIKIWDLESGQLLQTFYCDAPVIAVSLVEGWLAAGDSTGRLHLFRHRDAG